MAAAKEGMANFDRCLDPASSQSSLGLDRPETTLAASSCPPTGDEACIAYPECRLVSGAPTASRIDFLDTVETHLEQTSLVAMGISASRTDRFQDHTR
jgi:hypothetical protein